MDGQWEPSGQLERALVELPRKQRQALIRIVQAETEGVPLTRLLKTPYSCRWCGWVAGSSGQARDERKGKLAEHEAGCERQGKRWKFICNFVTYYHRWTKDEAFQRALRLAWGDVMGQAVQGLQVGTLAAVAEVRRQIREAASETNRLKAAFGLLDRAGVETAPKATESVEGLLEYVDVSDGELDAIEDALRREAEGGGET